MSDERFKNATKQHLIGEIKKLEQEVARLQTIERAASDRELGNYYHGQVIAYEKILDLVKTYHTKVAEEAQIQRIKVLEDLPF